MRLPASRTQRRSVDRLSDVPIDLIAVVGPKRISLSDALALRPGSLVAMDHLVGDGVDVCVGGKVIAVGQPVIIDEELGVRITDVVYRRPGSESRSEIPRANWGKVDA